MGDISESPNKRRDLPATPVSGRPPMPTPTPKRPPKPKPGTNTNSNNIQPPAIPTRPPAVQRNHKGPPPPVIIPNPAIPGPVEEAPVKPVMDKNQRSSQNEFGERTGSNVSNLRERFNSNSSTSSTSSTASDKPRAPFKNIPSKNFPKSEWRPRPPIPTTNPNVTVPPPALPVANKSPSGRNFIAQKPVPTPPIPTPIRPEPQKPEPIKQGM